MLKINLLTKSKYPIFTPPFLLLLSAYHPQVFASDYPTNPLTPILSNPADLLMPLNELSDYFIEQFDQDLSAQSLAADRLEAITTGKTSAYAPRLLQSPTYHALNNLRAIFETFDHHGIVATTPTERRSFLNTPKGLALATAIESGHHPIANQLMGKGRDQERDESTDDPTDDADPIHVQDTTPIVYPSVLKAGNESGLRYKENTWSITYDDGPHADRTPKVLQMLDDHKTKATFFEVTESIIAITDTSKKVLEYGMDLQNHSWSHLQSTKITQKELFHQIHDSTEKQVELLNHRPTLYRLPYGDGVTKTAIRQLIVDENMIHVFWNVDTLDWKDKDSDSIFARTKAQIATEKRGIILFHDIHLQTLKASQMTIEYLQNDLKSELVTVTEGIERVNNPE